MMSIRAGFHNISHIYFHCDNILQQAYQKKLHELQQTGSNVCISNHDYLVRGENAGQMQRENVQLSLVY